MSNWKRKIVRGIAVGSYTQLSDMGLENCKIERVWTIVDEELMFKPDKFDIHTGEKIENPKPKTLENAFLRHNYSVFLEDKLHDWTIYDSRFKYYTRIADPGTLCDLLIEYTEKNNAFMGS